MKISALIALLAAVASGTMLRSSCATQCIEKLTDGCSSQDFQCHCGKPGLIKQLQPCLQSACADTEALTEAKVAFTQTCKTAGVKINFISEPEARLEMARRADASTPDRTVAVVRNVASASASSRASGTAKGPKPATYSGAAVPRDVAGSMLGFVAAVAAAAAI